MRRHRLISPLVITLVVASCGGDDDTTEPTAPDAAETTVAAPGATIAPAGAATTSVGSAADTTEAAAAEPVEPSGTVKFAMTSIPSSMDPSQAGLDANFIFLATAYDGLIQVGPGGDLTPGLATDWTLSDDGLTFEMTLREGVMFQDDTPFDADAVVANIAHYKAEGSLIAPTLALIDSVEAVDPTTVRFDLNRPGGDLPELLRGYAGLMASPAAIAAGTLGTDPVGSGPFKVTSITDSLVTYEHWDGYWDAAGVTLAGVEIGVMTDDIARLNAAKSGQLNGTIARPDQREEAEAAGLVAVPGPGTTIYGLSLNPSVPPLDNRDVRQAISTAIDRDAINEFLYANACDPTVQLFNPDFWAYAPDLDVSQYTTYDPAAAKAAIEAAAPGGVSITLLVSAITAYQRLAEVLQQQLAEVGVTLTIETVDTSDRDARRRAGDYDAILSPLYPANPDPSTFAEQFYRLAPGSDEYVDPALPELIADARLSADRGERASAIAAITETVLAAGTPTIGVCIPEVYYVFDTSIGGTDSVPYSGPNFRTITMEL